jgi:hypothetical protein
VTTDEKDTDELWRAAGLAVDLCCMLCLAARPGRPQRDADLKPDVAADQSTLQAYRAAAARGAL